MQTGILSDRDSVEATRYDAGIDLLHRVCAALETAGWRRTRTDTYGKAEGTIRHHYTAGVWELTSTWPDGCKNTQKWDVRKELPDASAVATTATEHCHGC